MPGREEVAARRAEMYRRYIEEGLTQAQLAAEYGLNRTTVWTDLSEARKAIPQPTRESIRADHIEQLERIRKSMLELVEMEGVPVTAGKDGRVVLDPVTCAPVRDYSARIAASRELIKVIERQAKQLGSDAPTQVEHSGTVEVVDSVNAELQKLADQLGLHTAVNPEISAAADLTEAP